MKALCAFALAFFVASFARAATLEPTRGDAAPKLELKDTNGRSHDLAQYRGQVVLVNFWATYCEPCRHEMPSMQRLKSKLDGSRFAVLAVNVDEPDARVRQFQKETGFDLPVLMDPGKTATRAWSVRVMPTSFLVGPDGRVRYRLIGDIDWDTDKVRSIVSELLRGS